MTPSNPARTLYERLGGARGVAAISRDIVARHNSNPLIRTRFASVDADKLTKLVDQFVSMGSGGPNAYEGRDMRAAHRGMNLNERELVAAIDDILAVLAAHKIEPEACNEVLAIVYSLKDEVLFQ